MSDELDASGVHTNKDLLDDGNVGRNKVETEDSCPYRQDNNRELRHRRLFKSDCGVDKGKAKCLRENDANIGDKDRSSRSSSRNGSLSPVRDHPSEEALSGKESSSSKGVLQPLVEIADCVLIANEVIDDISKSKKEAVLFKADFSKVYDTIDWKFLNLILMKMGFEKRWRKWVHFCILSPSIVVLVNGYPSTNFTIKRGLRQGFPLSPLLFNVIGEALSGMLNKSITTGLCGGIGVGSENVEISYIQFADDLLIFSAANENSLKNFNRVLKIFELAAGLKLNMKKTKIFGINVDESRVIRWVDSINCGWASFLSTYLGLSLGHKKNSSALWKPVLDKIYSRLQGWKVDAINKVIDSFVWKGNSERGIHWLKWENICGPKSHGGLGFDDVKNKNRALLNKWIWRFGEENDSLWKKVIVAKYKYEPDSIVPEVFLLALSRAVSLAPVQDSLHWVGADNGRYTPKSFCSKVATSSKMEDSIWKESWKSEECSALVFLFVLSAIELPKLLIMYCVNATASGRFGNGGARCGKLVLYFLAMLRICCKFGFLKGLKRNSGIFGILGSSIGVWAYSKWPSLIQSVQDFVRCPESLVIGYC
ncbi:hypothetical protein F3Y22_tig00017366pilonHSYRG00007 [Hibiscus syriacus]|uniref:Reverse transcriptase domain-containing protein n=1 Tax=Hibiscus syriacus TaxID=106335 RepID=A0A6A3BWD8_HIBSY|nr:hypothetical protein F3Y22_tig00017366pilonHSYRG00007 [Hibiscus syriacus]